MELSTEYVFNGKNKVKVTQFLWINFLLRMNSFTGWSFYMVIEHQIEELAVKLQSKWKIILLYFRLFCNSNAIVCTPSEFRHRYSIEFLCANHIGFDKVYHHWRCCCCCFVSHSFEMQNGNCNRSSKSFCFRNIYSHTCTHINVV